MFEIMVYSISVLLRPCVSIDSAPRVPFTLPIPAFSFCHMTQTSIPNVGWITLIMQRGKINIQMVH